LIVAGLFEGEIVRRGQRQCKRGMLRSTGQDDTGEQMNLPCRREAEPHAPGPATKFGFQILASCGSHKGGKTAYREAKNLSTAFSTAPVALRRGAFVDFRFVGYTHRPRESDDLRFEFLLGFVLGHEFQDTFVNEVLNGPAGKIHEFSQFSHHTLVEFV
jgi:hypothetical protein